MKSKTANEWKRILKLTRAEVIEELLNLEFGGSFGYICKDGTEIDETNVEEALYGTKNKLHIMTLKGILYREKIDLAELDVVDFRSGLEYNPCLKIVQEFTAHNRQLAKQLVPMVLSNKVAYVSFSYSAS